MTNETDRKLEAQARRLLDDAAQNLDADTVARLRAARARAWQLAEQTPRTAARPRSRWWLPVGGLAVAGIVLAVAGTLWLAAPGGAPVAGLEDVELLASKESPEFYAELEFYNWLANRTDAA
jgi:hypothetical protein